MSEGPQCGGKRAGFITKDVVEMGKDRGEHIIISSKVRRFLST